jgi:hypothetical protein
MAAGKEMLLTKRVKVLQYPIIQLIGEKEKHTVQESLTVVEQHLSYGTYLGI